MMLREGGLNLDTMFDSLNELEQKSNQILKKMETYQKLDTPNLILSEMEAFIDGND